MNRFLAYQIIALASLAGVSLRAAPPDSGSATDDAANEAPANLKGLTLGGMQFWADELVFHEWRIQRHVYTGHCRLLDEGDVRRAWGTFEQCRAALDEMKRVHDLPPLSRKVVLTLHGLVRTRDSMQPLGDYVCQRSEYEVLHVGYPSTRADLGTHATSLASVIKNLEGVEEINFVAHSLGNLVIRHYLGDQSDPRLGKTPDPRIKRIVMIGPPNNGAQLAVTFKDNPLLGLIWGKSAKQLATDWPNVSKRLAVPDCEFGIIAGRSGANPLVSGEDDLVVSVEETRLPGARDFHLAPVAHTFLRTDEGIYACTLKFLERGCFVSEEERKPITAAAPRKTSRP